MKLEDADQVILDTYGRRAILGIAQEECAELIKACSKFNRSCGFGLRTTTSYDEALHDLIEEIADAEHCIRLLKQAFRIDVGVIEGIIEDKASRSFIKKMDEEE